MAFYGNKFRQVFNKLYEAKNQTKIGKRLGTKFIVTCNAELVSTVHKESEFSRSSMSRRMVEQNGAVGSMVSHNSERAKVKRKEIKKYLNNKIYKKVLDKTLWHLEEEMYSKIEENESELYTCVRTSLHYGFMEEFLGINYTRELRDELKEIAHDIIYYEETIEKLGILNIFPLPLWIRNLFSPILREKNKKFAKIVKILYDKAEGKPGSWFNRLKELEINGTLSRKEVLGEIRAIYISSNTLALGLAWAIYRLSIDNPEHVKKLVESDSYARYCFMEALRLYPPFPMVSYEKESKCPFHRNDIYIVSTYLIHRNPMYWKNPQLFDPSRFESGLSNIKKGSYIPFGGGERYCPGAAMSLFIGPKILQTLFEKYDITNMEIPDLKQGKFAGIISDSQRDKKLIEENLKFYAKIKQK